MKRGDVVIVAAGSGFGGKPRPAIVVQDDAYLDISTVLLALFSSDKRAADLSLSVAIEPSPSNGLRQVSWVLPHELVSVRLDKVGKRIGRVEVDAMRQLDRALILFLGLDRV